MDGKESLEKMGKVGAFVINAQMNQRPSRFKVNKSPYEIYYGKQSANQNTIWILPY
jgi:hypothetical protein